MQLLLAESIALPLILTGLTLVLGVTAELSPLHARLLPASLIAAIFTLSLAGNMPVWEPLLIYALGTLWYGAFNWFWFWMWREQPLRESLSLLYVQLADYCEAKYTLLTQHTDPEKAMPPLLVARMRSHSSEYYREIVERRDRLVKDVDDFVASAVVLYDQMNRGGPAGNAVVMH